MRANTRSPMPATGPASRLLSAMTMRGAGPCSSSHTAGRAMNSPSASRPVISITVTGGKTPGRVNLRREPAISPSSAMARNMSFNAMRSPPLIPKARAISRLPASLLAVARKSRISCREGSLPTVFWRGAPLDFATGIAQPAVSSTGSLPLLAVLRTDFLAGFFLAGSLPLLAAISSTASSRVTCSGARSRGSVALTLACLT